MINIVYIIKMTHGKHYSKEYERELQYSKRINKKI